MYKNKQNISSIKMINVKYYLEETVPTYNTDR